MLPNGHARKPGNKSDRSHACPPVWWVHPRGSSISVCGKTVKFYINICLNLFWCLLYRQEEFDDTKGVIWIRKSKKNRQWPKEKGQKDKQWSTKHTHSTKDRVTRTPLKAGGELRCSGRVDSFCSTRDTRRVNLVTNLVISHEWGKDQEVFTTYTENCLKYISLSYFLRWIECIARRHQHLHIITLKTTWVWSVI
jgi:hypothetical protein